jgi:hypothetical protein
MVMMNSFFYTLLAATAISLTAVAQSTNLMNTNKIETATLGGGCFWYMDFLLGVLLSFYRKSFHAATIGATK